MSKPGMILAKDHRGIYRYVPKDMEDQSSDLFTSPQEKKEIEERYQQVKAEKIAALRDIKPLVVTESTCSKCKKTKDVSQFCGCKTTNNGLQSWCKQCANGLKQKVNND